MMTDSQLKQLTEALQERLRIIADHAFRDRDPGAHLKKLQEASEEIEKAIVALPHNKIAPKLCHYLERRSYDKALCWLLENIEHNIAY